MSLLRTIILSFLLLSLTACGYHLRGSNNSLQTIESVSLISSKNISFDLAQKITRQLEQFDVQVNDNAKYKLTIIDTEHTQRRVASSRTSFSDRYIMRYTINANLAYQQDSWPINSYNERLFENNDNTPSAKSREKTAINNELQRQVIENLASQVRGFKTQ